MEVAPFLSIFTIFYRFSLLSRFTFCRDLRTFSAILYFGQNSLLRNITLFLHVCGLASCKWSYGGYSHLQMITRKIHPLANDHLEGQAICKWPPKGSALLKLIIQRIWTTPERYAFLTGSRFLFFLFEINPEFWPQNWLFWDFFFVTTFFIGFFVDSF